MSLLLRSSSLNCSNILPRLLAPLPRHTPQNVSFQLFPSISGRLPVCSSISRSWGSWNFCCMRDRITSTLRVSQFWSKSRMIPRLPPACLAFPGVSLAAIFCLVSGSLVLAAWKACSTVG